MLVLTHNLAAVVTKLTHMTIFFVAPKTPPSSHTSLTEISQTAALHPPLLQKLSGSISSVFNFAEPLVDAVQTQTPHLNLASGKIGRAGLQSPIIIGLISYQLSKVVLQPAKRLCIPFTRRTLVVFHFSVLLHRLQPLQIIVLPIVRTGIDTCKAPVPLSGCIHCTSLSLSMKRGRPISHL